LLPKADPKNASQNSKACPWSCLKAGTPQNYAPKLFSKTIVPKLRFCKPIRQNAPQSHPAKRLPKATSQNYRKLFSEIVCIIAPESCSPKLFFFKAINRQSCSRKLAKIVLPKGTPQSGSPKLLPKTIFQNISAMRLPQSCYLSNCYGSNLFSKMVS
jgi:hypothetical protein